MTTIRLILKSLSLVSRLSGHVRLRARVQMGSRVLVGHSFRALSLSAVGVQRRDEVQAKTGTDGSAHRTLMATDRPRHTRTAVAGTHTQTHTGSRLTRARTYTRIRARVAMLTLRARTPIHNRASTVGLGRRKRGLTRRPCHRSQARRPHRNQPMALSPRTPLRARRLQVARGAGGG